jgi:selenocysteine lyase/cysteine desulfurase
VLLCVDGVHGFGVEDAAVAGLGCDFFSSGCHKWLFGPRGTGVLWGSADAWARHTATIPSFARPALGAWFAGRPPSGPAGPIGTPGGFHTFEHRWALPEAFAWHERRGRAKVARRTHALARRLKDGLHEVRGVRVKTPASQELSAGLVCVDVRGHDPAEVVERLRREHRIVASQTPYRESYVRFGPSILNDEGDVDSAVAAMAKIVS